MGRPHTGRWSRGGKSKPLLLPEPVAVEPPRPARTFAVVPDVLVRAVRAELAAGPGPFVIANRHGLSLRQVAECREVAK